jgi:hypothetical protein
MDAYRQSEAPLSRGSQSVITIPTSNSLAKSIHESMLLASK